MTFRGVVRDGLIIIDTRGELPDGTRVRVVTPPAHPPAKSAKSRNARSRATKQAATTDLGFGMWKHRTDIRDAGSFSRALRKKASRRGA